MKSFYEMLQIIENKLNEGKKYLIHYDSSKEVNIGEVADQHPWDGLIKIGYNREDDGSYFPVAWGIEGSLIKYKEDENGEIWFDKDRKPVIEKEFENPGVHGENIPEPYLSGSKEVNGFKDAINAVLAYELREVDAGDNPDHYEWEKFDGAMGEEPDTLFAHHSKITHDGKEITLGKLDDYSARQLPWYDNPSKIDPKEIAEAEKVARQITNANHGDENEYRWRLRIYTDARTGRGQTGAFPWWMYTHEQALKQIGEHCYHQWEKAEDFNNYNQYLYTGESGHYRVCKRCGLKEKVVKWSNNYSGD